MLKMDKSLTNALTVGLLCVVAACATPRNLVATTTGPTLVGVLATVRTQGGLCPGGPCDDLLTISADGMWSRVRTGTANRTGRLTNARLTDLRTAIATSSLPIVSAPLNCTGGNGDDPTMIYTVITETGTRSVASCVTLIDGTDKAIKVLDDFLQELT